MFPRIFVSILVLIACLWPAAQTASAADGVAIVERPDNEYLILGVTINGYTREDGIEAWLPEGASPENTLLPLSILAQSLTFAIDVNPGDGTAKGWFVEEANGFELDLTTRQVFIKGKLQNLSPGGAEAHIDDIYVQAGLLEKWFGLDINVDLGALLAEIKTDAPLPFLAQMERRERAENVLNSFSYDAALKAEDAYLLPYKMFTTPSLLVSQDVVALTQPGSQRYQTVSTLQANMELLKFGADLNMAYNRDTGGDNDITTARLTFQRRDPRRELLGPIKTGKIAFGDINFPSTPLLLGSKQGSGVTISSDPELGFRFARVPSDFFLEGEAPVGWDAELYRNGSFIDFQIIGANGRFRFDETDLLDGYNQFQIILYGPEGQKRTVTRDVYRGPNMLRSGELVYDFAAGMPQRDFLPLARDRQSDTTPGMSGQIYYGFNNKLTAGISAYAGPDDDDKTHGVSASVSSAFLGLNTQLQTMIADGGRRAYEASLRMRPMGINMAATHTVYQNFSVEDQELKRETGLTMARNIGRFNVTLSGRDRSFLNREGEFVLENIVSTDLFGAKLTNSLVRTFAKSNSIDSFDGELSVVTTLFDSRVRSSLTYDLDPDAVDKFRTLRISALKKLSPKDNLRFNANYDFPTSVSGGDLRYTHQFKAVSMDINAGATSEENYTIGLGLRVGLQPGAEKLYDLVPPNESAQARLGLRAYLDKNDNNVFDEGDEPIKNVVFEASRGNILATTNEDGLARMHGLVEMPTKIGVSADKIPSIYLVPKQESLDLIPRRGAEAVVDYAFTQLGEVDGFVMGAATPDGPTDEPLANVPVRLINTATGEEIREVETEYDGYYVFSAVPLGSYKVITSLGWFEEGAPDTVSRDITLSPDEPAVFDQDLSLPFTVSPEFMDEEEAENDAEDNGTTTANTAIEAAPAPQNTTVGGYVIHIASYKTQETAEIERDRLEKAFPALFESVELRVLEFEVIPGDFYFRIIGPPTTKEDAAQKCAEIAKTVPDGCRVLAYQPAQ